MASRFALPGEDEFPGSCSLQVGGLYWFGLEYPKRLPLTAMDPMGDRQIVEAVRDTSDEFEQEIKEHVGDVLQYHHRRQEAIILVGSEGTPCPDSRHKSVPWMGIRHLPNQPLEWILPTPGVALHEKEYYMNFSHAIRVRVVSHYTPSAQTTPDQAFLLKFPPLGGIHVRFADSELTKLVKLHRELWRGTRYADVGTPVYGYEDDETHVRGDVGVVGDQGEGNEIVPEIISLASMSRSRTSRTFADDMSGTMPHRGSDYATITGRPISELVALSVTNEEFRVTQLELVKGVGFDSFDSSPQIIYYVAEYCEPTTSNR